MHLDPLLHNFNSVYFFLHGDESSMNMMEELENHALKSEYGAGGGCQGDPVAAAVLGPLFAAFCPLFAAFSEFFRPKSRLIQTNSSQLGVSNSVQNRHLLTQSWWLETRGWEKPTLWAGFYTTRTILTPTRQPMPSNTFTHSISAEEKSRRKSGTLPEAKNTWEPCLGSMKERWGPCSSTM
jgi:hypothetical protein